jgi:hypothetical protein
MRYRVTIRNNDGSTFTSFTTDVEAMEATAPQPSPPPETGEKATEKQIKALYAIVRRKDKLTDNQDISQKLRAHFKVRRLDEIPREQATAYIREHNGG